MDKVQLKCLNKCPNVTLLNYISHVGPCDRQNSEKICWNCRSLVKNSALKFEETELQNLNELKEQVNQLNQNLKKNDTKLNDQKNNSKRL
jgi:hypothetical protein